jgi:hypothetical protein
VQLLHSARRRLIKRPRAKFPVIEALSTDSSVENDTFSSESRRKRARKTTQLPQFDIYHYENFRVNSPKFCGSKLLSLNLIGRQTEKIWPYISVKIPFRPEFHQNSSESSPKHANREPLALLLSIALNGARKAPKFPQDWLKNQLNDHTSTFFTLYLSFFIFLSY